MIRKFFEFNSKEVGIFFVFKISELKLFHLKVIRKKTN